MRSFWSCDGILSPRIHQTGWDLRKSRSTCSLCYLSESSWPGYGKDRYLHQYEENAAVLTSPQTSGARLKPRQLRPLQCVKESASIYFKLPWQGVIPPSPQLSSGYHFNRRASICFLIVCYQFTLTFNKSLLKPMQYRLFTKSRDHIFRTDKSPAHY